MDEITLKLNSQQNYKNNIETNKPNSNKKLNELKEISNQFESIFINQILKQARQNKIENGLFDSEAINTFNSMIDEQYSEILSKKTNFGISEALFNQFKSQVVNERKK
ncbi:rod-binding protein [bacterium]|nr:rod-binding protein [bacterium]